MTETPNDLLQRTLWSRDTSLEVTPAHGSRTSLS
jgi:hypothetical protein